MEIQVIRRWFSDNSTIGEMMIDGEHFCFTLEPRKDQSQGKPYCIPEGIYDLIRQYSGHFQMVTPHVLNVEGFTEIEIHPGNYPKDTEGCTLVGLSKGGDAVLESRPAFEAFMARFLTIATITYSNLPETI